MELEDVEKVTLVAQAFGTVQTILVEEVERQDAEQHQHRSPGCRGRT